jgi:uncharacterized protein (DUF1697 family)
VVASTRTTSVIALLRGINVGGKNKIAMAALRQLAADAGYADAKTYVQSGNIVLPSVPVDGVRKVAAQLRAAIEERTGLDIPVITRTIGEWQAIIDANPFPAATADGTKLHVVVLDGPVVEALATFDARSFAPEEVSVGDGVIYLSLPEGIGRSKLAIALQRVGNAKSGTSRNWRTVVALAELASG